VYNNTRNEITDITSFWTNYEYDLKYNEIHEIINHKVKSNFKHCQNQETASRSNEKTWQTDRKENRSKIILDWRRNIFLNKQHLNEK
jgi:molybdenum cofactor biosynthesis enzyme MoaA